MKLKEKIEQDFKEAFKNKEEIRLSALKMLRAAISNAEIEKRGKGEGDELSDEEIEAVVSKEAKKRREALEIYEREGREDLAERERKELEVLSAYLPEQLSEEEVRRLAEEAIKEAGASGPKEMGKVMAVLMPKVKGRADGSLVSRIVKELLGN